MKKFEKLEKFVDILANHELEYPEEIFPPPISAQFAFDCVAEALLGPDYYTIITLRSEQWNTETLDRILRKYSKDYRKIIKKKRKELKHHE